MRKETADILALLDAYTLPNAEDAAMKMADDFRKRRIEKGITREEVAAQSGVALSNVARFEQKGMISLKNLLALALAIGYLTDLKMVFSEPKYSTMEELLLIRRNMGKKKAYPKSKKSE